MPQPPNYAEARMLLENQMDFINSSPPCIICGSSEPTELGMMTQGENTQHFVLCDECKKIPNVNDQVLLKLNEQLMGAKK